MLAHNYYNMIIYCTISEERKRKRREGRREGREKGRTGQLLSWAFHRHYFYAR